MSFASHSTGSVMENEMSTPSLSGRWVHSHEEDEHGHMVFRPGRFEFPPSRGRLSFTLEPDGAAGVDSPGPTDRPVSQSGTWRIDGDRLILKTPGWTAEYVIESIEDDRLVVRRS